MSDLAHFFTKLMNVFSILLTFRLRGLLMTSGLHENDKCMERFAYFSFWCLFMLNKIYECMKRFAYFSLWGLFMPHTIDECMHRFAYFPFRWLLMLYGSHTFLRLLNFAASQKWRSVPLLISHRLCNHPFRLGGFWCFMVLIHFSGCWIFNSEGQSLPWYLIAYVTILMLNGLFPWVLLLGSPYSTNV